VTTASGALPRKHTHPPSVLCVQVGTGAGSQLQVPLFGQPVVAQHTVCAMVDSSHWKVLASLPVVQAHPPEASTAHAGPVMVGINEPHAATDTHPASASPSRRMPGAYPPETGGASLNQRSTWVKAPPTCVAY